jgi:hypothetical protein
MKPLNLDNRPCSPISSNCVIWQGPDIPCIKLCTGDTVSDVVAKLGTELCTIMDQLKVTNYDLTCLGINACPPEDFQALIQLLINKICELSGITPTETKSSGCPDCVVSVAPCFVEGTQTTMQLVDYVQMIANRICSILDEIGIINNQITSLDNRVTILENTPPPVFTLPEIPADCILPPGPNYPIDQVIDALLNDDTLGYCALLQATGTPGSIVNSVLSQCISDTTLSLASQAAGDFPIETFAQYYFGTWVNNTTLTTSPTVANAINNIWIAICDIYNYLSNGFPTTVVAAGEGITVTSATVGSTTTYTVENDYLETFVASCAINSSTQPISGNIPLQLAANASGIQSSQIILKYNSITSNNVTVTATATPGAWVTNGSLPPITFGSFDNDTTGEFTISDPGTYLIVAAAQLKSTDSAKPDFWQSAGAGAFLIGIQSNGNNAFTGNYETLAEGLQRQISISSSVTAYLAAGTIVRIGALNLTDRNYNGNGFNSSDIIRFGITKLR